MIPLCFVWLCSASMSGRLACGYLPFLCLRIYLRKNGGQAKRVFIHGDFCGSNWIKTVTGAIIRAVKFQDWRLCMSLSGGLVFVARYRITLKYVVYRSRQTTSDDVAPNYFRRCGWCFKIYHTFHFVRTRPICHRQRKNNPINSIFVLPHFHLPLLRIRSGFQGPLDSC